MTKMLSASRGLCPWTPLGALPLDQTLVIGSCSALAMVPLPPTTDPFRRLWPSPGNILWAPLGICYFERDALV